MDTKLTGLENGIQPTCVLADDNRQILAQVSKLLQSRLHVEAAVESGTMAVQVAVKLKPDLAILDIAMPGMSGIEAAHQIQGLGLPTRIIFLTIQRDAEYEAAAAVLGAGYVLKSRLHCDLPVAIEEALAGRAFVSTAL